MLDITPCLWFDDSIEEAVNFYVKLFRDAEVYDAQRYPDGRVLTMRFRLKNQEFTALNGGPDFKFNEAVSFQVDCKDQAEVDYYWAAMTADGGEEGRCSWLKDRFGLSWQIVPEALPRTLGGSDRQGAGRAMQAMMKMKKIIVADLENAYAGK